MLICNCNCILGSYWDFNIIFHRRTEMIQQKTDSQILRNEGLRHENKTFLIIYEERSVHHCPLTNWYTIRNYNKSLKNLFFHLENLIVDSTSCIIICKENWWSFIFHTCSSSNLEDICNFIEVMWNINMQDCWFIWDFNVSVFNLDKQCNFTEH